MKLRWRLGRAKAWIFRPVWAMKAVLGLGPRIQIGRRFSLQGRLIARGPGTVEIGDDCIAADTVTPFTHSPHAVIRIGSRTFLNGTRFGCAQRIEIGEDCILADARIMDTDFHSLHRTRNTPQTPPALVAPVQIGKNVWVAAGSAILKGVQVGDDSVIGFGAVVTRSVPAGKIFAGNPAIEVGTVP